MTPNPTNTGLATRKTAARQQASRRRSLRVVGNHRRQSGWIDASPELVSATSQAYFRLDRTVIGSPHNPNPKETHGN